MKAPAEFVALHDVDPTIVQEIRYHTGDNFVGRPIDGYLEGQCILTRPTAEALKEVQRSLCVKGYRLKVYDGYRPQRSVNDFVAWSKDLDGQTMKDEYYPRIDKERLFSDGYIAVKSGHSRGSTVDLTIERLCEESNEWETLDMGTGFDHFGTLSHTLNPHIGGQQRSNRLLLKHAMEGAGFFNLPEEWWHYTLRSEPFPDTYFDFPVARNYLTSVGISCQRFAPPRGIRTSALHELPYAIPGQARPAPAPGQAFISDASTKRRL
jgi:D-alanyl-D-alanine dipeptidase